MKCPGITKNSKDLSIFIGRMRNRIHTNFFILLSFLQEENNNNNSLPNQHAVNDDDYNNDNTTQLLQNLTASQNTAHQNDTNDSLLALAVALRSAANVSPDHQHNLRQHLSINRNFTTTTTQLVAEKLLAPSISDLDSLAINNRPHKPPDLKGKQILYMEKLHADKVLAAAEKNVQIFKTILNQMKQGY